MSARCMFPLRRPTARNDARHERRKQPGRAWAGHSLGAIARPTVRARSLAIRSLRGCWAICVYPDPLTGERGIMEEDPAALGDLPVDEHFADRSDGARHVEQRELDVRIKTPGAAADDRAEALAADHVGDRVLDVLAVLELRAVEAVATVHLYVREDLAVTREPLVCEIRRARGDPQLRVHRGCDHDVVLLG